MQPTSVASSALMAELVDALVSNTNGASRAGSSPAQGTKAGLKNPAFVYFQSYLRIPFGVISGYASRRRTLPGGM